MKLHSRPIAIIMLLMMLEVQIREAGGARRQKRRKVIEREIKIKIKTLADDLAIMDTGTVMGGQGPPNILARDVNNICTCSADRCLYIVACMPRACGGCVDVLTTH